MNSFKSNYACTKGSSLITVIFLVFMMAILSASIIGYSVSELRSNERTRLSLRSENVAENIALYAAEQLTAKLQRMGTAEVGHFPWSGPATNTRIVYLPPASTSGTDNVLVSEYNTVADVANMEVRAGIEAKTAYALVTDTTSANNGLQVATANVPIIAKGTATHKALGTITTYVEQNMQLTLIPLFQFGMFYNMDLELYPSGNFTLTGPVHTNNSLLAHPDVSSTNSIVFMDRATAADYIFAYQATKCATRWGDGTIVTPGDPTLGFVRFTDANNITSQISMKSTGTAMYNGLATNLWADCRWGDTSRNITTALPTTTQLTSFKNWATSTYNGNLRAGIHGVTKLVLPGIGGYKETNDSSTPEDDRSNGRQIIESPDHKRYNGSAFNTTTDTSALKLIKISWRAGLYIMVNPDDTLRTGKLPNGNTVTMLPRSYRCWLSTPSGSTYSCTEVILPGQPSYGQDPGPDATLNTVDDFMYPNYMPNRLMMGTSVGSNQVLRTIQQPYGTGTGYVLNMAPALGNTAITVSSGTGTILMGDTVTIGNYNYLVTSDLVGTTFNIASPGFVGAAAPANGTAVTINAPVNNLGTADGAYTLNGIHANGTNSLRLNRPSGTGTFLPGSTITLGANKYLITAAPTVAPTTAVYERIYIAAPGIFGGDRPNGAAVTVDATLTKTLGNATDYLLSAAHAGGVTTLNIDTGVGNLLPGNTVGVGVNAATGLPIRYLVTSAVTADIANPLVALTTVRITPALAAAAADNARVVIDPYAYSGYATTGNNGSGSVYPGDSSANAYAAEAYFYDIRRANNNGAMGAASARSAFSRSTTNPYTPRPIAKIDLDMARLKMMVSRVISGATTSTGYRLLLPDATGAGWDNSIYNGASTTTTTALGLGIYNVAGASYSAVNSFPAAGPDFRQNPFGLYRAPTTLAEGNALFVDSTPFAISSATLSAAWHDGVAIYIHSVDAEVRAQTVAGIADRVDSGVRLWNGRGPVASLTASTKTGCTIATNDAVYTVGHYNADGTINSTVTATGNGGYSSKWPDSGLEYLCSVYGDATSVLSQPTYTQAGAAGNRTYYQSDGWADAYSALPASASADDWDSAAAGGQDGVYNATTFMPGVLPTINKPGTLGTAIRTKLDAVPTEVSTALVIGIVPSNHSPTGLTDRAPNSGANNVNSGGANNFPRFLESWGDAAPLYVRGSMVALFESRVAMEPFTHSRCYNRPDRKWGLHVNLSLANHDVPLEPVVYSADRLGFRRLTAAQYATRKTAIESWTELLP